jgi:hypothetical protein
MNSEKRNRYIISFVIILMILIVVILGICVFINKSDEESIVSLKQIYVSDYKLVPLGDKYYLGKDNNTVKLIIDKNGNQLYYDDIGIKYDNVFYKGDNNYLFYTNKDNVLECYLFNGKNMVQLFKMDLVKYAIPLVHKDVDEDILIGFVEHKDNDLYIYNLDNTGMIVLKNASMIGDKFDNHIYYVNDKDYIIIKKDNKYGVTNLEGKEIISNKYDDMYSLGKGDFIVKKDNKFGIINNKEEIIIPTKYKIIKWFKEGLLIGDNKLSIYDTKYNKISNNDIETNITDYNIREDHSLYMYKDGDIYIVLNNYKEDLNDYVYDSHKMYIYKNNKFNIVEEKGFSLEHVKYSYKDKELTIYNDSYREIKNININLNNIIDIYNIGSNKYYIEYKDNNKTRSIVIDDDGKELDKYGKIVLFSKDYVGYKNKNNFLIVSKNNKVLEEISGNDIIVIGYHIIIDDVLYEIK